MKLYKIHGKVVHAFYMVHISSINMENLRINHLTPFFVVIMSYIFVGSYGGQIILRTSSDVFVSNLGLRFEGLFEERYVLKGQNAFEGH